MNTAASTTRLYETACNWSVPPKVVGGLALSFHLAGGTAARSSSKWQATENYLTQTLLPISVDHREQDCGWES